MKLPLSTLFICATAWSIATEILVFDYLKYNARLELLEQTARALRAMPTQEQFEAPEHPKLEHL